VPWSVPSWPASAPIAFIVRRFWRHSLPRLLALGLMILQGSAWMTLLGASLLGFGFSVSWADRAIGHALHGCVRPANSGILIRRHRPWAGSVLIGIATVTGSYGRR
jgi:hypothetical protein